MYPYALCGKNLCIKANIQKVIGPLGLPHIPDSSLWCLGVTVGKILTWRQLCLLHKMQCYNIWSIFVSVQQRCWDNRREKNPTICMKGSLFDLKLCSSDFRFTGLWDGWIVALCALVLHFGLPWVTIFLNDLLHCAQLCSSSFWGALWFGFSHFDSLIFFILEIFLGVLVFTSRFGSYIAEHF